MDISLSDVIWVFGGLIVFSTGMTLIAYRREIAQAIRAVLSPWGVPRPGLHPVPPGSGTGSYDLVLPHQNQANQEPVRDFATALDYLARHNVTPDQAIDLLAVLRWEDDSFVLSANKIRDLVGGADAVVKARVAAHRPKLPAPKQPARLERPANGW